MYKVHSKLAMLLLLTLFTLGLSSVASAVAVKGIYLTQTTLENTKYVNYLIERAHDVGINTFVVDMEKPSKLYKRNIQLLKNNNIKYVARVVVFPDGGRADLVASPAYWAKRYALVQAAINYGANEVQLDYIRYNTKQPASVQNSHNVMKVVQYFKDRVEAQNIPLQADVFGISSFGESKHIGQNLRLMAKSVDALCPMVYPSHFEPFRSHAITPYQTIYNSLRALQSQFNHQMPVKLYAYIEISNYRFALPGQKRRNYVISEMKAVEDAGADGYFVWSAHNKYDYLFDLLEEINKDPNIIKTAKVDNGAKLKLFTNHHPEPAEEVAENDNDNSITAATPKVTTETHALAETKPVIEEEAKPIHKPIQEADATPAKPRSHTAPAEVPTPQHHVYAPPTELSFNNFSKEDPLRLSMPEFGFNELNE